MFSCFNPDKTPGRRCEWQGGNLRDFTRRFNQSRGTTYALEACLDVTPPGVPSSGIKEPEVLLKGSSGERPMVIERKQVVTESYARHHGNLHVLYDLVPDALMPRLGDAHYALEVSDGGLRDKRQKEVRAAAREIADSVIADLDAVKGGTQVGGRHPFPWRFGRVPAHARDEDAPEVGIGVQVHGSAVTFDDPGTFLRQSEEAYAETKGVLERLLADAARKFVTYADHLKVVVLEFYGDTDLLGEDEVRKMVGEVELPALIDEVWVARQEWTSDCDYDLGYERLR